MKLNEVVSSAKAQLADQAQSGVQVEEQNRVPSEGPARGGLWWRIPSVTAVFIDLKSSTELNAAVGRNQAAYAYTYFLRAMSVILEGFSADYTDIQGDAIFGLFSGRGSLFTATACAITMRTEMERSINPQFKKDSSANWNLEAGIGIDRGTLLVRRLGLRGTKQNEVWVGKPVNVASKLSSVAGENQIVVSGRVYKEYENSSLLRKKAIARSCGCRAKSVGPGLRSEHNDAPFLWNRRNAPENLGLDFDTIHKRDAGWCTRHGAEYCEAIVTGKLPAR